MCTEMDPSFHIVALILKDAGCSSFFLYICLHSVMRSSFADTLVPMDSTNDPPGPPKNENKSYFGC